MPRSRQWSGAMYAKSFVYSLMGVDAGEPLNHILIRKEAERKTGGNWWWGLASNIAKELEEEATSNGGTLPVLFAAVAKPNDGVPGQKACVWNGWQSRDGNRGGRIPDHALVISGYDQGYFSEDPKKKKKRYYALVCQSEAEVEALAPAVIGAAIGSQIRETGPNRRAEATPTAAAPFPGGPLGGVAWSHFGNTSKTAERFLFFLKQRL